MEISAVDAFGELIALFKVNRESVDFRRLIHEFIDQRPCLGSVEIDDGTAFRGGASELVVGGKPSDQLLGALAAARAIDQERRSFGSGERHSVLERFYAAPHSTSST
jgi:hypothetical protein